MSNGLLVGGSAETMRNLRAKMGAHLPESRVPSIGYIKRLSDAAELIKDTGGVDFLIVANDQNVSDDYVRAYCSDIIKSLKSRAKCPRVIIPDQQLREKVSRVFATAEVAVDPSIDELVAEIRATMTR